MGLARDLGFGPVVFGQHFLAAEAGPTRRAVSIYLLPLLNPMAVAEKAASLDIVTGVRCAECAFERLVPFS